MYELRFLGANEKKDRLVVFELDEKRDINIYLWVSPFSRGNNRVDVGYVTRIYSYLNHVMSPFAVREEECSEIIEKALEVLEGFPKDVLMEKIMRLDQTLVGIESRDGDWFKEWDEVEAKMFQEIEQARVESGYWPWAPGKSEKGQEEVANGQDNLPKGE